MKIHKLRSLTTGLLSLLTCSALWAQNNIQDLLPLQKGYVVATCHSSTSSSSNAQDLDGPVVALIDGSTSELALAPTGVPGGTYPWRKFHNEVSVQNPGTPDPAEEWKAGNLGEVFGITLDDDTPPNIYVAATAAYGNYPVPAGNSKGTVYRLDGTTGDITPYNCIPAGNPSLGNLTFWTASNGRGHLYVSNLDDGLIYRLDGSGECVGTYNHGVSGRPAEGLPAIADATSVSYTQLGRRVWGVEAYQDRLYYGVWNDVNAHTVWSVGLDPSGTPLPATAQLEIPSIPGELPVSDIAFSQDGRLFLAQRYHRGVGNPFYEIHEGSILEYTFDGTNWIQSPIDKFKVGNISNGTNSAGGVDVECSGAVWGSGDALNLSPNPIIYGVTRIPATGNQTDSPIVANSHLVDLDGIIDRQAKTWIGDVETYDPCESCFEITDLEIECPRQPGSPYTATFTLTNLSGKDAAYLWHTPCPDADLPDGTSTGPLVQTGPQPLDTPLPTGESTTVTINIPSGDQADNFCWNITLLDNTGEDCCTEKICVTPPDCDCFIVRKKEIRCEMEANGRFKYTLSMDIQNTSTFTWEHLNLLPPTLFSPSSFDLSASPIAIGETYSFTTCVRGRPGDRVCFNIATHNQDINECCSKECCIILPPCEQMEPDYCAVTRRTPCCRDRQGNSIANITLTVCNNSDTPRTYIWGINGLAATPGCPGFLPNDAFGIPSGSINVGANSCANIIIPINCKELQYRRPACYEVCVRQRDDEDNRFCCRGQVFVPRPNGPVIKVAQNVVDIRKPQSSFEITNTDEKEKTITVEIASQSAGIQISSPDSQDQGFAAMQRISIKLAAGETQKVDVVIREKSDFQQATALHQIFIDVLDDDGNVSETGATFLALIPQSTTLDPQIKSVQRIESGALKLIVDTKIGQRYQLQSSHTIGGQNDWKPVSCHADGSEQPSTEFTATGSELDLTLMPNDDCPSNFYRAIEIPSSE